MTLPGVEARADRVEWWGEAGAYAWSDPANWNPARVPAPADDVLIGGTPYDEQGRALALELGASRTVRSLSIGGDQKVITLGSAADAAAGHSLTISSGSIGGGVSGGLRFDVDLVFGASAEIRNHGYLHFGRPVRESAPGTSFTAVPTDGLQYVSFHERNTYSGATDVEELTFTGAEGASPLTTSISAVNLRIDNSTFIHTDRVPDAAPVHLRRTGGIQLAGRGTTERIGPVTFGGIAQWLTADEGSILRVRSLSRAGRALGSVGGGGRVVLDEAPTLIGGGGAPGAKSVGIVAFLAGGGLPVTYDAGADGVAGSTDDVGLRPLADSEFSTYMEAGPGGHVRMSPGKYDVAGKTIGTLTLAGSWDTIAQQVNGGGTLSLTSGMISTPDWSYGRVKIAGFDVIDFGEREAIIRATGGASAGLEIASPLRGSGGLTVSGPVRLSSGGSTYTGPVHVLGSLHVYNDGGLGMGDDLLVICDQGELVIDGRVRTGRSLRVMADEYARLWIEPSNALTLDGPHDIDGMLQQSNRGTLVLVGDGTGSEGELAIGGTALVRGMTPLRFSLASGSTLAGTGVIGGGKASAGAISPGDLLDGVSLPGTLTTGDLSLGTLVTLRFQLGAPDAVNDLLEVDGDLRLDGRFSVIPLDGFSPGVYRLINYTGDLTDLGMTNFSAPSGYTYSIDTSAPGQVNLVVIPEPVVPSALFFAASAALSRRPRGRNPRP